MNAASPSVEQNFHQKETPRASLSDWLAVVAGTISSFMATLDISIVNAALPTIQGEVGASGTEGTWISTSYLVSEIIMIPLASWFVRVLGLRNFLFFCALVFTAFSIICGMSDSLIMMIVGRIGQGFAGGALIPTALTIVATRLPAEKQPLGTAMFGMTVILGPIIGPILGGWLTENISWHYAFFVNVPVCLGLLILLFVGLPFEKADWRGLLRIDFLGVYGLAAGLGGLTVILEEGQRERWFESELIIKLSVVTLSGFVALILSQFQRRRPVVRLSLLLDRSFSAVLVMIMAVGMILFGVMFIIPQFLATISGYNAEQSGLVVLLSGIPTLMMMPFVPILLQKIDVRLLVFTGMIFFGLACILNQILTVNVGGSHFVMGQLLQGCGLALCMLPLNQAAISTVAPELAGDASGLFSAARNLGGSMGLALISTFQDRRLTLHTDVLGSSVSANSPKVQEVIHFICQRAEGARAAELTSRCLAQISKVMRQQALVLTYSDLFWIFGCIVACAIPLVFLLKPLPSKGIQHVGH